jgi:hypothetical protein
MTWGNITSTCCRNMPCTANFHSAHHNHKEEHEKDHLICFESHDQSGCDSMYIALCFCCMFSCFLCISIYRVCFSRKKIIK